MGCGKSTLARKLSRRTGVRAVDTDAEVERMGEDKTIRIFSGNRRCRNNQWSSTKSPYDTASA